MTDPNSVTVPSWFGPIRIVRDPDFAQRRPVGKVRGRRRYYRMLHRKAESFAVRPDGWYDLMHWHVDWPGMGNIRWRERREHLAALFTSLRRLLAETRLWPCPHQAWLYVDPYDSSQDAVYLHTPNPNRDNYPHPFAGTQWDATIPHRLCEFVTDPAWQFGRLDGQWTTFIVRERPAT